MAHNWPWDSQIAGVFLKKTPHKDEWLLMSLVIFASLFFKPNGENL